MELERTLIIFKPDAIQRGIVGEIFSRFEKVGLKFVGLKMLTPDDEHFHAHYEGVGKVMSRHGQDIFDILLAQMKEGPVIAGVLEGVHCVELVRKMVGPTEPAKALPGTIRGDYAHSTFDFANSQGLTLPNVIHASADASEAKEEVALWFDDTELYDYSTVHEKAVHGRNPKNS